MVRASTLPLRQTVEDFGCDLSYNEEIIDKRLVHARRFANPHYKNVIEYYIGADVASASTTSETKNPNSNSGERKSVFRTTVEERAKNRTIFQLGTCDPDLALRAAETVIADVAGVDVNMGCPKSFSVKGGMGAALLAVPDSAAAIVKKLRDNLPGEKSVTCKIRMNEDLRKTRELVLKCLLAGADAVAVHMRFVPDRPRQPARWPLFGELLQLLRDCGVGERHGEKIEAAGASNVDGDMMLDRDLHELVKRLKTSRPELDLAHPPLIANGDFFSAEQVRCFRKMYPKIPVMIARGAQWNPALFWDIKLPEETVADAEVAVHPGQMKPRPTPTIEDCIRLYVQKCVDCGSSLQEIKWNLVEMVGKCNSALTFAGAHISVKQFTQRVSQTKRLQDVLEIVAGGGGEATCGDHVAKPFCSVATGKMLELRKTPPAAPNTTGNANSPAKSGKSPKKVPIPEEVERRGPEAMRVHEIMQEFAQDWEKTQLKKREQAVKKTVPDTAIGQTALLATQATATAMQVFAPGSGSPAKRESLAQQTAKGKKGSGAGAGAEKEKEPAYLKASLHKQQMQNTAAYKIFSKMYLMLFFWFIVATCWLIYSGQQHGGAARIEAAFDGFVQSRLLGTIEGIAHGAVMGMFEDPYDFFSLQLVVLAAMSSVPEASMLQMAYSYEGSPSSSSENQGGGVGSKTSSTVVAEPGQAQAAARTARRRKRQLRRKLDGHDGDDGDDESPGVEIDRVNSPLMSGGFRFRRIGEFEMMHFESDLYPSCIAEPLACNRNLSIIQAPWYGHLQKVDLSAEMLRKRNVFRFDEDILVSSSASASAAQQMMTAPGLMDGGIRSEAEAKALEASGGVYYDGHTGRMRMPFEVYSGISTGDDAPLPSPYYCPAGMILATELEAYKRAHGIGVSGTAGSATASSDATTATETTTGFACVALPTAETETTTPPPPFLSDQYDRGIYTEWEANLPERFSPGDTQVAMDSTHVMTVQTISLLFKIPIPESEHNTLQATLGGDPLAGSVDDLLLLSAEGQQDSEALLGLLQMVMQGQTPGAGTQAPPANKPLFLLGKITLEVDSLREQIVSDPHFLPEAYQGYIIAEDGSILVDLALKNTGVIEFMKIWEVDKFAGSLTPEMLAAAANDFNARDHFFLDDIIVKRLRGKRLQNRFFVVFWADSGGLADTMVALAAIAGIVLGALPYTVVACLVAYLMYQEKVRTRTQKLQAQAVQEAHTTLTAVNAVTQGKTSAPASAGGSQGSNSMANTRT
eukprot:g5948.t1